MKAFGITDKGLKRKNNEDAIFFSDEPVGALPNLYIVADGMGGHKAGEMASQLAVNNFIEFANTTELSGIKTVIKNGIRKINTILHNFSCEKDDYRGMGTTFVTAVVIDDRLYVGNVGDSRAYVIRDGLYRITIDHTLVEEMVISGLITIEEAKNHPDKHVITRAIGAAKEVDVDYFELMLGENDRILLCSDGLNNMVQEERIYEIISNQPDLEIATERLIEEAKRSGGDDNISVILIKGDRREVEKC